ncbi:MAG: bifunctional helix-turn-helix transcriptional regulator/GNAT family N-acetyltransferase [Bryobacteraceae bacterium]|jgi:DNA-binding MarR family transcriptional regulator/N-acetylglutamate synthase-like GNAT family acetyltransferase
MSTTAVRRFNRFYTGQIGVLRKSYLNSDFSLAEARVIYELGSRGTAAASEIARDLGLDAGYLSRMLEGFAARGLVTRKPSAADKRQVRLKLGARGRKAFQELNRRSDRQTAELLERLPVPDRERLVESMENIESLLEGKADTAPPFSIRTHQAGDIGWVIHRHGVLYEREYGWGALFEALVAEVGARFLKTFDPERERCWIAERHGVPVGSIFLVKHTPRIALLRLLLVEPNARGLGVGKALVEECIAFARQAGYRKMRLWTQAELKAAQHIYSANGFKLVEEQRHAHFGVELMGQSWELEL